MALEDNTEKLFKLYQSDPEIKDYINSLPQNRWLPELQKMYDKRHSKDTDGAVGGFAIAAAAILFSYLI